MDRTVALDKGGVVVTGASTGIGEATALHLDRVGYHVFAGVRKESDGDRLRERAGDGLMPILLDVTDAEHVAAAVSTVEEAVGDAGLAALVNNAGISLNCPLEVVPLDELRRQFDINVIGAVAVTQAFLPMLREARGRIVNMSSISGKVAVPVAGPYCASKFALEALSDTMRQELRPWGIDVVVIEPGPIKTPIWKKALVHAQGVQQHVPEHATALYGPMMEAMGKAASHMAKAAVPAEEVAVLVERILAARRPKTRYTIGPQAWMAPLLNRLPDRVRDWIMRRAFERHAT